MNRITGYNSGSCCGGRVALVLAPLEEIPNPIGPGIPRPQPTFTLEEAGIDRKLSTRAQKLSEYEVRAERKLGEILKAAKAGQRIIKKNALGFLHSEKKMVSGA